MPRISDEGFIIYIKKYNEKSSISKIISKNSGLVSGFLKKSSRKEDKYSLQIGSFVRFEYIYRNLDLKGTLKVDNIKNNMLFIIENRLNLAIFNSVISILINSINENDNISEIYEIFEKTIAGFEKNDKNLTNIYINFLFKIVNYLGININLNNCAVSGVKKVIYMSPKTANCVSEEVGEKYKDKLFIIPKCFFCICYEKKEIVNSINILHHFIEKIFFENDRGYLYKNINLLKNILIKEIK